VLKFPDWRRRSKQAAGILVCALILLTGSIPAADVAKYHTYEELSNALKSLAGRHADIARLAEVARTRQGRTVWALEIANTAVAPADSRPALLVVANLEGDQVAGSELALQAIELLLDGYATKPELKRLIDTQAFYFIPRLNPDAAEMMFAPVKTGQKANLTPQDDDNDGRIDEDPAEDLNGDGAIALMRVKDAFGAFMIHPEDARLMKRADPLKGEKGGYAIYIEGIDNDGDGFLNEDGPGGVDLNRNFQHRYPYYAPEAGRHMVNEAETRGLMDYVIRKRNIAAILTFGESDNLVGTPNRRGELGPPSILDLPVFGREVVVEARKAGIVTIETPQRFPFFMDEEFMRRETPGRQEQQQRMRQPARRPAETIQTPDLEYFRTISEKYRSLTGIRATGPTRAPAGAFFEYGYYQFGVPSFSTPGWGIPPAGGPGAGGERGSMMRPAEEPPGPAGQDTPPSGGMAGRPGAAAQVPGVPSGTAAFDLRLLKWMDAEKIDGFLPWTPYRHPKLGDVEVGGIRPYAAANPPEARLADLAKTHSEFILYLASLLPRISIAKTEVTGLGGGLYRIKAEVENSGYLPTALAHGVTSRSVKPTMIQLGIAPEALVSGDAKTSYLPALAGSGRRQKYEWIVKGTAGSAVPIKVVSQKGGSETATIYLK